LLCEDRDPAHLLAAMTLPRTPFSDVKDGVVATQGDWSGAATDVGRVGCFRIYDQAGTCHLQGSVGLENSSADMIVSNDVLVPGQRISVQFALVGASGPQTGSDRPPPTAVIDDADVEEALAHVVRDGGVVRAERTAYGDLMRRALNKKRS
jgi:hypothetical protein